MSKLFLDIFNLSITASWLILAVLAVRFVFRKRAPKWVNCLLWSLVGFRLLVPFTLESRFSLIPARESVSTNLLSSDAPSGYIQSGFYTLDSNLNYALHGIDLHNVFHIFSLVWLVGVAALLIHAVINYFLLKRRISTAVPVGITRKSEAVESPFVLGLFRPRIYIPFGLSKETEECVVAHEKAHIKRRDHLIKPLGYLLLSVYWFNPLVWIAYILLCRDIETACDERVVRQMDPEARKAYATALLECSIRKNRIAACPLAFGEIGVKERVVNTVRYKKPAVWCVICALVACVFLSASFLTSPKTSDNDLFAANGFTEYINSLFGSDDKGNFFRVYESNEATEATTGAQYNSDYEYWRAMYELYYYTEQGFSTENTNDSWWTAPDPNEDAKRFFTIP